MKRFLLFIMFIFASFFMMNNVSAAGATISASSNKSRVIVGETVTVTVKISSTVNLGSWQFDVVPSSNLSLVSSSIGGTYVVDSVDSSAQKSKTYTFVFKAKSSGNGTVTIKNSAVYSYDEEILKPTNGSTSFKMMTQAELQATYSKNNYLSSLKVDGYTLEPAFNKDVTEYNLTLENGTESVNVSATKEDSTATYKGGGKIVLNEGINKASIVVTAQNGSTKTYTINITVKELKPIEVNINGNTYNVVRKVELMPKANELFEPKTIMIGEEEVPAYYNEASSITLVGLSYAGDVKLYEYDGNYKLYSEIKFNQLHIKILDMDMSLLDEGYNTTKINILDESVVAYVKEGYTYPVIYGLNIETGVKSLYKYDSKENTLQIFENIIIKNNEQTYFYVIIGLTAFMFLSYIIFIILLLKKNKKNVKKIDAIIKEEF